MSDALLVVCVVEAGQADTVAFEAFAAGATAVEERTRPDGAVELRVGFETSVSAERALRAMPVDARLEVVDPTAWIQSQRPWIDPTSAGPFEIVATWLADDVPRAARHRIIVDPGGAFGHGGHPSTRLLLELLPEIVEPGLTVVDVGTGTGVLAIAAAMLGAEVVAIDNDPTAVEVARGNVERNDVADRVAVALGDMAAEQATGDVALVNVTLEGHRTVAPHLRAVPVVAVSGLVVDQIAAGVELYEPRVPRRRAAAGDWIAAVLEPRS